MQALIHSSLFLSFFFTLNSLLIFASFSSQGILTIHCVMQNLPLTCNHVTSKQLKEVSFKKGRNKEHCPLKIIDRFEFIATLQRQSTSLALALEYSPEFSG